MPSTEPDTPTTAELEELVALARGAIHRSFDRGAPPPSSSNVALHVEGASFVTLKQRGQLRGCIGTLVAHRPLHEDVAANAVAAAFRDPRFPALLPQELVLTMLEVSVLSRPEPLPFASEDDFYRALRAGVDGLILAHRGRRATYLPSVWEQLPDARRFVGELRRKAGIEPSVPLMEIEVQRYTSVHSPLRPLAIA